MFKFKILDIYLLIPNFGVQNFDHSLKINENSKFRDDILVIKFLFYFSCEILVGSYLINIILTMYYLKIISSLFIYK